MNSHYVRTDVRDFLAMMEATPRPAFTTEVLSQIRKLPPDLMASMDAPVGELGSIQDATMPGPGGDIALRLFDSRAERAAGPVIVFFHGGGFCVGSIDTHAGLAAEIARQLDLPVVSVEYRLAPENTWPAAPDDGEAAARWIADNGAVFGRTFTSMILCGDSAGANLAIVTSLALREKPASLPLIMQFPIYPLTDHTRSYPSGEYFADGYGLESVNMELYNQHLAPDVEHWRASPLLADQAGLPPTLVVTAGLDPLRDQGRAYAVKALEAGVPTTYIEVPGTIHGFAGFRRVIPSAQADLTAILAVAKTLLVEHLGPVNTN
jgi:acetyl esterase